MNVTSTYPAGAAKAIRAIEWKPEACAKIGRPYCNEHGILDALKEMDRADRAELIRFLGGDTREPADVASSDHRFVLKIEDGCTSWRIICPDEGAKCGPANACGSCGRTVGDEESKPCYDCPTVAEAGGCWVQSWVGQSMAEEVLHGTVEVEFPVLCQWTGEVLEAHVSGPVASTELRAWIAEIHAEAREMRMGRELPDQASYLSDGRSLGITEAMDRLASWLRWPGQP